jgi:hypothetical protein
MVAGQPGPVPPGRLHRLRAGLHPPHRHRQPPRDQRLPADRAGAGRDVADGGAWRAVAEIDGDDGRADRRPRSPTSVNNLATRSRCRGSRQRDPQRAAELSRPGPPRLPGFPAAHGFRRDEPGAAPTSHWDFYLDLVKGDLDSADAHRKPSTTSTTPCWTCRPSTTWTPSAPCSRNTCCRAALWDVDGERCARRRSTVARC